MVEDTYRDPFKGCQTREDYLSRFEQVLQQEMEVAAHLADYLELRSKGKTREQAATTMPRPQTAVGQRVKQLSAVVDVIFEAHELEGPHAAAGPSS